MIDFSRSMAATRTRSLRVRFGSLLLLLVGLALAGCAETPHRPYVRAVPGTGCDASAVPAGTADNLITPELGEGGRYTLHFLEFDDQGWAFRNSGVNGADQGWTAGEQIDCAIADLAHQVEAGEVRAFVYVHGWHHSAADKDRDLNRFRDLLKAQAADPGNRRRIIGFYLGWGGETVPVPLVKHLTFWGRKNAAHHVSEGSVREFFARVKALRNHYNRPNAARSVNCGKELALTEGHGCPLRTVMIGHSFGAWILFSATSPYVLETLSGNSDLPDKAALPVTARERGIADLIVLLNPAFEASRYDAVYRAGLRYRGNTYEPPLLVSVTSTADAATGAAFPIARFFNSLFQYPATSREESLAMKHTHGHLDGYLTHDLTVDTARESSDPRAAPSCVVDAKTGLSSDPQAMRQRFFNSLQGADGAVKMTPWTREFCGGLTLTTIKREGVDPFGIIWNVRTFKDVIPGHDAITTLPLRDFIVQVYGDVGAAPKLRLPR